MNRYWIWGLSVALACGMGGLALAGDPNMQPGQTTLMQSIQNFFSPKPKPTAVLSNTPATITAPLTPAQLTKCLQAEQDAYWRRISVCDALRTVADEKGEPSLGKQADELERQATALYNARVTALGLPRTKAQPAEVTMSAMRVEEPVSPKEAANRLSAPPAPSPIAVTAEMKEVKP